METIAVACEPPQAKVKLVHQMGEFDSGAACVAMVLNLMKASDAYPHLGYDPNVGNVKGTSPEEIVNMFRGLGWDAEAITPLEVYAEQVGCAPEALERCHWLHKESWIQHRLENNRDGWAIVRCEALNQPEEVPDMDGWTSYVVIKKGMIYDPQVMAKQRYKGLGFSMSIDCCIFLKEPRNA